MSELLGYQYRAREKQVAAIAIRAEEELTEEIATQDKSYLALVTLLMTPPILFSSLFKQTSGSEEAFFEFIAPATEITAKKAFVLDVLLSLFTACNPLSTGWKEVPIDQHPFNIPIAFKTAFKNHENTLTDMVNGGRNKGTMMLLTAIQKDTPLMRYRRDLAEGSFQLIPSLDKGAICYLNTKIPAVSLKLWYPKDEISPKVSLSVDKLTED